MLVAVIEVAVAGTYTEAKQAELAGKEGNTGLAAAVPATLEIVVDEHTIKSNLGLLGSADAIVKFVTAEITN